MRCLFWTDVAWVSLTFSNKFRAITPLKTSRVTRERSFFSVQSADVSQTRVLKRRREEMRGKRHVQPLLSEARHLIQEKAQRGMNLRWWRTEVVLVILLMLKNRVEKNNNKGRVMLLLSANTTFCHSLSLCCLLKQTLDKVFSLESGLKEQAIRQHFYFGWALDIISPSDRTGALDIRSLTHQIRRDSLEMLQLF